MSSKTVRKVLRGQSLGIKLVQVTQPRKSKLEPFIPVLQRLLLEDELTTVLAFEELRSLGYDGR